MKQTVQIISIDRIKDPERPLRTNLTPESVDDLVFSIKEVGIIQPLIVCESGKGFELIAGHRRLLAAEIIHLNEVPCIVVDAENLEKEVLKMHENIGRQDINPIDWAIQLDYLKTQYNLSSADLAKKLGFSEAWVSQHLDILKYPEEVLEAIQKTTLSFSAARELALIKDPVKRKVYVNAAVKGGCSPSMAIRWKLEANRESLPRVASIEEEGKQPEADDLPATEPICPVCGKVIAFDKIINLQVHEECRPAAPVA